MVKQKFFTPGRSTGARPIVTPPNLLFEIPGGKNPVSLLHELYSTSELTIDDEVTSETPGIFLAKVRIENSDFQVWRDTSNRDICRSQSVMS